MKKKKYSIKYLQRNVKGKDDVIIWLARRRRREKGRGRKGLLRVTVHEKRVKSG